MKKNEIKKEIKEAIREVVIYYTGKYGNKIFEILYNKKNVNEFLIAKKTKLNINQVRNMLYKLANRNLITFLRKRDKKTKWYIYYWTLRENKILEELKNLKLKKINEIENIIKSKHFNYYICPNKCVTMKEDTALLYNFFCPECGELLQPKDTKEEIEKLKKEKEKIIKLIEKINEIISYYKKEKDDKEKKKKEKERRKKRKK